jgi:hypothetical protein
VRARALMASQQFGDDPADIRRGRQMLLELERTGQDSFGTVTRSSDFFSTSTCRDLLFHVQEHRTSLTAIDQFLRSNGLHFLGMETEAHVRNAYRQRFPQDATGTDLGQWQVFENENPDVFFNMYQFWIQKPLQG